MSTCPGLTLEARHSNDNEMIVRRNFRKALVAIGGGLLILLGLAGLALPVLPGTVFLIAGLLLWSSEFRWAKRILVRVRRWIRNRTNNRRTRVRSRSRPRRNTPKDERD